MRLAAALLLALLATAADAAGGGDTRHWAAGLSDARLADLLLEQPTARLDELAQVSVGVGGGGKKGKGERAGSGKTRPNFDLPSSPNQPRYPTAHPPPSRAPF